MVGKRFAARAAAGGLAVVIVLSTLLVSASPVIGSDSGVKDVVIGDVALTDDIIEGASSSLPSSNEIVAIGSTLFFTADNDDSGHELFRMEPPYIAAILVEDIYVGEAGAFPVELHTDGTNLFFSADDGVNGREPWVLEPPYNDARMVADVNPGIAPSTPTQIEAIGTTIFFAADDGSSGRELWAAQSPFRSANRVADLFVGGAGSNPLELTQQDWTLFFTANDSTGREVWKLEPPYGGPTRVTDIDPGGAAEPRELTFVGDNLFFSANDPVYMRELWLSEPPYNPTSTRPVNDFETRYTNPDPLDLHAIGNTLFFSANIGLIGREVWKVTPPYDTTEMVRVMDVREGFFASSLPDDITSVGDVLFFTANDGNNGRELWRSESPYNDDTTFAVDVWEDGNSSNPADLTPVLNSLFFVADGGTYGREVWKLNAPYTERELKMTGDVYEGSTSSNPSELIGVGSALFFQANSFGTGLELWTVGGRFGIPATGFAPARITPIKEQPANLTYQTTGMTLELPSQGVQSGMVGVPVSDQGWDLTWLGASAGYLEGSAFPTWAGNSVITGHAILPDGNPGPFAHIDQLKWGDRVIVHAWGQKYVFEVRSITVVDPDDMSVFAHEDLSWLTLVTCHQYDEDSGQYLKRVAVRAVLINVE